MRLMLGILATVAASNVFAIELDCAEDKRTNAYFCFAPSQLHESGGIRFAPLYKGGPVSVSPTSFTIAANCNTGSLHLKDKQGVSFAGSDIYDSTPQVRELRRKVCAAAIPAPRKKRP